MILSTDSDENELGDDSLNPKINTLKPMTSLKPGPNPMPKLTPIPSQKSVSKSKLKTRYQPVRLHDLQGYVRKRKDHKTETFQKEFDDIGCQLLYPCTEANKYNNTNKNRFRNILPYDHSRVILKDIDDGQSDYINASYIKFKDNPKAYIASQGPNEASVNDTWRMVWQESNIIVMVTNLVEKHKMKCIQYWPEAGETNKYGDIFVQNVNENVNRNFTIRTFRLKINKAEKFVRHYQFTAWVDIHLPTSPAPLLEFIYEIKDAKTSLGPVIVHCSDGVGRTGIVITIDAMLDMAEEKDKIDVYNFVKEMRENKLNMVQTQEQYVFIYETILESLFCEPTHIPTGAFMNSFNQLKETNSRLGRKRLQEQQSVLDALSPLPSPDATRIGTKYANVNKNRYPRIVPLDNAIPFLLSTDGDRNDYINASFCKGYGLQDNKYVVTQAPMPNTVSDFWRLIYEYNLHTIVMLNNEDTNDKTIGAYFPQEFNVKTIVGPFIVQLVSSEHHGCIIKRTLHLSKIKQKRREIHHFQYCDWPNNSGKPTSVESFLQLRSDVDKCKRMNQHNIVAVHCLDGRSRCGYFCAVDSIIQMINEEAIVDVFQNIKRIKSTCPSLIKSKEQYKSCYETAQYYLDSFETYGNFQ
ncbi:receptor-type tyrosine-protein phosphatase T-like [Antedon mediterranea]|uniref:receptor-type tyrosine-protein phosphatase T-like n=1 Tax=Antedon mediterranea TaxID=105859 RepID=UPI003AF9A4D8